MNQQAARHVDSIARARGTSADFRQFAQHRLAPRARPTRADTEHFCVEDSIAPSELKASHVGNRVRRDAITSARAASRAIAQRTCRHTPMSVRFCQKWIAGGSVAEV